MNHRERIEAAQSANRHWTPDNEDAKRAQFLIDLDNAADKFDLELSPFESDFLQSFINRLPDEPKDAARRAALQTWSAKQRAAIDAMRQKFSEFVKS